MQNADAQRLKMLSLIRQSMFQEALDFNFPNLVFEKAYCFYRLNQLELASSTISTLTSRKALLLKAQIYYRQERFYDAALLYADILNSTMKSESCYSEIAANLNASIANATLAGFVLPESLTCVESSTYELSFNLACIRLAQNRIKEAGSILQNCQIQGFEELKNQGHTEKEIEREMALVMTQIGYQHQLCGDLVKAKSCYEQVMKFRSTDLAVSAIITNNTIILKGSLDVMDSMKKLQALNSKDIFTKLTSYQRHHINMNRLHLSMFITSKSTQTIDLAKSLTVEFPESDVPYIILSKVALKRKNTFLKEMSDHLLKMPKSLSLRLMVIDYLVSQKDFLTALKHIQEILSSLPDNLRYSLKLLQIAIPIYIETNTQTTQLIKSAVDYWSKYSDYIIEKIADIALDNKCYEIAAEIYQTLVKKNPENQNALSNLVLAFSNFNLKDAKTYIEYLPKVEFDEVEDVEEGIVALSLEPVVSPVARLKNKRRRKKAKVVDPNLKLDPERWLPKRERGLRGKKAKKDLNKGPQGVNMAGGGIGGTGSARIAGYSAPKVEMEEVPVVVISGKAAGKKKKGKK